MRNPKPAKPYPDFPLSWHPSGTWCKKIKGKVFYFGKDADAALRKYLEEKDDRQAGRTPRPKADALTLRTLANAFLTSKKRKADAGELSLATWRDYYDTCADLLEFFGKDRAVLDLAAEDFERLRSRWAKRQGAHALAVSVQKVRTLLKFAYDTSMIDRPVRFGPAFCKPSRKAMRKARHATGPRMFEANDIRRLIDAAGTQLRAMILLATNCGYGQTDLASLPRAALDLERGWVNFPRPKTAIMRRCPLWPETIDAVKAALEARPAPDDVADADLVFITKYGKRWVRHRVHPEKGATAVDSIQLEFGKLLTALELKRPGIAFYALRHTHRTITDAARDPVAANYIMGHVDDSMGAMYRERLDDSRLRAVADCVRQWLFPPEAPAVIPFSADAG